MWATELGSGGCNVGRWTEAGAGSVEGGRGGGGGQETRLIHQMIRSEGARTARSAHPHRMPSRATHRRHAAATRSARVRWKGSGRGVEGVQQRVEGVAATAHGRRRRGTLRR